MHKFIKQHFLISCCVTGAILAFAYYQAEDYYLLNGGVWTSHSWVIDNSSYPMTRKCTKHGGFQIQVRDQSGEGYHWETKVSCHDGTIYED